MPHSSPDPGPTAKGFIRPAGFEAQHKSGLKPPKKRPRDEPLLPPSTSSSKRSRPTAAELDSGSEPSGEDSDSSSTSDSDAAVAAMVGVK